MKFDGCLRLDAEGLEEVLGRPKELEILKRVISREALGRPSGLAEVVRVLAKWQIFLRAEALGLGIDGSGRVVLGISKKFCKSDKDHKYARGQDNLKK